MTEALYQKNMNYAPHEIANLFPMMLPEEFVDLKEDIKARGLLEPVVLHEGKILDGRNRFKACQEVGVAIQFVDYAGDDPLGDVISWNLKRRHLNSGQKATIAVKSLPMFEARAKARQVEATILGNKTRHQEQPVSQKIEQLAVEANEKKATQEAAKAFGTNRQYIADAKNLEQNAPELAESVNAGELKMNQAKQVAALPTEEQLEVIAEIKAGEKPSEVVKKHVHVAQNSGNNEWYKPQEYIDAARAVLGQIDLDPASNPTANEVVKAAVFYSAENSGLDKSWAGNVWMNPPYSSALIGSFISKLVEHYSAGDIKQAIVLVNNATDTGWFAQLTSVASSLCFPKGRVKFWAPDKIAAPLQGQAILYLGENPNEFEINFSSFGLVARVVR